jgi:amidase
MLDSDAQEAVGRVYRAAVSWIVGYWTRRVGRGPQPHELEPQTWAYLDDAAGVTGGQYLLAVEQLQRASRRVAHWFEQQDLWLTPTVGGPPEAIGALVGTEDDPLRGARASGGFLMFDGELANITGNPAMSVPLAVDTSGLPIGMSFLARYGDEATLLRLAAQLEQARPWSQRRPAASRPSENIA